VTCDLKLALAGLDSSDEALRGKHLRPLFKNGCSLSGFQNGTDLQADTRELRSAHLGIWSA
jgi:hypothetical protein